MLAGNGGTVAECPPSCPIGFNPNHKGYLLTISFKTLLVLTSVVALWMGVFLTARGEVYVIARLFCILSYFYGFVVALALPPPQRQVWMIYGVVGIVATYWKDVSDLDYLTTRLAEDFFRADPNPFRPMWMGRDSENVSHWFMLPYPPGFELLKDVIASFLVFLMAFSSSLLTHFVILRTRQPPVVRRPSQ